MIDRLTKQQCPPQAQTPAPIGSPRALVAPGVINISPAAKYSDAVLAFSPQTVR